MSLTDKRIEEILKEVEPHAVRLPLGWKLFARAIEAEATKQQEPVAWNEGYPQNPWDTEWFIAKTKYGDKVVLRKLPKEYTHDFTTADGTYMKKENITMWMQFPESEFIAPHPVSDMDILDIVLKISEEMGLEDDEANLEFAQRVIAAATPQSCQSCAEKQSAIDVWEGRYADLSAKCAELEAEVEKWSTDFVRISDNYSEEAQMNMDFGAERLAFILKEQKQAERIAELRVEADFNFQQYQDLGEASHRADMSQEARFNQLCQDMDRMTAQRDILQSRIDTTQKFLEFLWRDAQLNDYTSGRLEEILAMLNLAAMK